jgi:hypothetical protein
MENIHLEADIGNVNVIVEQKELYQAIAYVKEKVLIVDV